MSALQARRGLGERMERAGLPRPMQPAWAAVVAAGAASLTLAVLSLPELLGRATLLSNPPVRFQALAWPTAVALALVLFVLQRQGFVFRWRGESTKISLDEVAVFVGALLLSPAHLTIAVAGGTALNQAAHRRDLPKAAFNVAQYAFAGLAAGVVVVLVRAAGVAAPWAALVAPFVFAALTALQVARLFARSEGSSTWRVFRERFARFAIAGSVLGATLGLVVVALYLLHPLAVFAIAPIVLYVRRFGRLSEWADAELTTHQTLSSVSADAAGRSDLDSVTRRILHACHDLFSCGEAQLTLALPDQPEKSWHVRFGNEGTSTTGGASVAVVDAAGGAIGTLRVAPKPSQAGYGEREHHLLRTVAATISAAAANAQAIRCAEEAYAQLRDSERRYRSLFETGHVMLHVLDERGRIVSCNPAAAEVLGEREENLRDALARECVVEPDVDDLLERLREAGEVRGVQALLRRKDGSVVPVLLDGRAIRMGNDARQYVLSSRDITQLKTLEADLRRSMETQRETIRRLENMNRELEEFTLWTTHDMREPLRSIGTIADILHEDLGHVSVEEARDMTSRIRGGAERLKERVKALHAFSRIVQRDDAFGNVDMQAVVENAVAALETKMLEKGAGIRLPQERLPVVRAQPHRIDQVVANLLENALKYGAQSEPVVAVGCEEAGEDWRFSVHDNGPGVPPGYHERIFQLFQRGPQESREGGTGAGLAIVKRIVEQHGGRAWVESPPEGGARFVFTLPRAPSVTPVASQVAPLAQKPF